MKLSEIEDRIAELRAEFGNLRAVSPDALEPGWVCDITSIEYDHDRELAIFTTD